MTDVDRGPFSGQIYIPEEDSTVGIGDRLRSVITTGEAAAGDFVERTRTAWKKVVQDFLTSMGDNL
jgi:hypothetical protein